MKRTLKTLICPTMRTSMADFEGDTERESRSSTSAADSETKLAIDEATDDTDDTISNDYNFSEMQGIHALRSKLKDSL